ncbi:alkylglycerol monooxygenase isoform X2 [Rhineura floridana]|uniref:alkylglycerol monooxygenase isoform X2 n=1 Tax=Rhineura floridana TaxID=261503 RepID=UPI002AC7FA21|nr:alkylglycerol monooxygenase isoform X2 [Rhineura floridana]
MAASFAEPQQALSVSQQLRLMFYTLTPKESSFRTVEEVPDYVDKATPLFITLILLEIVVKWIQKGSSARFNDSIACLSAGVLSRLPDVLSRSVELTTYIYVWENYRLCELPWDSPWTWYMTFLGVDFGYYWFHRMAHEINLLWVGHQVHHSSEDYNLFTALRQSVLQKYTSWIFYLPMALFIPPSVYAVHLQFNLLYQFWIHTEVIKNLGPLEFLLNTPSHHRVHHGRNRYCIDKNYGGTLIIWDRMFGTFAPENDKVVYGLTHPINSFELFKIQTLSQVTILMRIGYIILTLTSIGFLMEQRPEAPILEIAHCSAFLTLHKLGCVKSYVALLSITYEVLFSLCIAFWGIQIMKHLVSSVAKH